MYPIGPDNLGSEDETKEFKRSLGELESGLISLTAMLNKNCHGTVYFGANNRGEVIGIEIEMSVLKTISRKIRDLIDPIVTTCIEILESVSGKKYIKVSADGTDRPYACDGIVYIRSGKEDSRVSMSELREMILNSDDNLVRSLSEDQDLTFNELRTILKDDDYSEAAEVLSFYLGLDLVNPDNSFNIQAQLLSDQNPCVLAVTLFKGTDKTFIASRTEFSGHSLLKEVQDLIKYVFCLNETLVEVGGWTRIERKLFEPNLFREAWVNACVHNNWLSFVPPSVFMFDDRIEIVSYGGKPYRLSEDEFYSGMSMPVNGSLMRLFKSAGLAEHTGHGVKAIVEKYGKEAFKLSNAGVTVTLRFPGRRAIARIRPELPTLTKNEKLVLETLRQHPNEILDRISEISGVSRPYVGKIVVKLKNLGLVERKGSNKSGYWVAYDNYVYYADDAE